MKLDLGDIAKHLGLPLKGDASISITGIANLQDAEPGQLTFLFNSSYASLLPQTKASAVVLREVDAANCHIAAIVSNAPRMSWAHVARLFDPTPRPDQLQHQSAVIHPTASIGNNVSIAANVVIEGSVSIGDNVCLGPGCVIGVGSKIGANSRLSPTLRFIMT